MKKIKTCAIILTAGCGSRMQLSVTKQQITIAGKSVLHRTLLAFEKCNDIDYIVVVIRPEEMDFVNGVVAEGFAKVANIVIGGSVRAESAFYGFSAIPDDTDYVAIHDGARCLITPDMISKIVSDAKKYGAATAATYLTDTVKKIDENGFAVKTYDRRFTVTVQTPQIFRKDIYEKAIKNRNFSDSNITDDNMLVEGIGEKIYCTDVGKNNIKITYASDIKYAEYILSGGVNDV